LVVIFMTIIFVGVQYLGSYFDAKQRALGKARECAWAFSKNACVPDASDCGTTGHAECLPPGCAEVLGEQLREENLEREPNEELATNINRKQDGAQGLPADTDETDAEDGPPGDSKAQKQKDLRAGVKQEMNPMMELLVGQSVNPEATAQILVPRMIPDAQGQISVSYYLPCNLKHHDPLEVAMSLFGSLFPDGL
jgi:hypothetical protein